MKNLLYSKYDDFLKKDIVLENNEIEEKTENQLLKEFVKNESESKINLKINGDFSKKKIDDFFNIIYDYIEEIDGLSNLLEKKLKINENIFNITKNEEGEIKDFSKKESYDGIKIDIETDDENVFFVFYDEEKRKNKIELAITLDFIKNDKESKNTKKLFRIIEKINKSDYKSSFSKEDKKEKDKDKNENENENENEKTEHVEIKEFNIYDVEDTVATDSSIKQLERELVEPRVDVAEKIISALLEQKMYQSSHDTDESFIHEYLESKKGLLNAKTVDIIVREYKKRSIKEFEKNGGKTFLDKLTDFTTSLQFGKYNKPQGLVKDLLFAFDSSKYVGGEKEIICLPKVRENFLNLLNEAKDTKFIAKRIYEEEFLEQVKQKIFNLSLSSAIENVVIKCFEKYGSKGKTNEQIIKDIKNIPKNVLTDYTDNKLLNRSGQDTLKSLSECKNILEKKSKSASREKNNIKRRNSRGGKIIEKPNLHLEPETFAKNASEFFSESEKKILTSSVKKFTAKGVLRGCFKVLSASLNFIPEALLAYDEYERTGKINLVNIFASIVIGIAIEQLISILMAAGILSTPIIIGLAIVAAIAAMVYFLYTTSEERKQCAAILFWLSVSGSVELIKELIEAEVIYKNEVKNLFFESLYKYYAINTVSEIYRGNFELNPNEE